MEENVGLSALGARRSASGSKLSAFGPWVLDFGNRQSKIVGRSVVRPRAECESRQFLLLPLVHGCSVIECDGGFEENRRSFHSQGRRERPCEAELSSHAV